MMIVTAVGLNLEGGDSLIVAVARDNVILSFDLICILLMGERVVGLCERKTCGSLEA